MIRSAAQRKAWLALSPNKRRILLSHIPDDFEREMNMHHSIMTALENVYGPRVWDPGAARIEDGDDDGERRRTKGNHAPEMTYGEIGEEMGISVERVRQIEQKALRKLRHEAAQLGLAELMFDDSQDATPRRPVTTSIEEIEAALMRALEVDDAAE